MKVCSVDDCEKPCKTRGYCNKHYVRLWRTGSVQLASSPDAIRPIKEHEDGSTERWRPVPGYEDRYEVSDLGRVRNLRGMILRATQTNAGYRRISLKRDCVRESIFVHRLVLIAFQRHPEPLEITRHLNGDGLDNRLENLAWGTPTENNFDTVRHGRHVNAAKTHCPVGHPYSGNNVDFYTRKGMLHRRCRICLSDQQRARRIARKQATGDAAVVDAKLRKTNVRNPAPRWGRAS